ncbi:3-oxoacyl-[acyl-carrier protein] reductase [alpha proteobacterium U9-1i]|nr:3-oxoacyl-[acyl-carrier protein] reductase [alpha proteobacterium U9-1i]
MRAMSDAPFFRSMFDLTDRVVLVTGGARGIGFSIAEACAAWGARALIVDVNAAGAEAAASRLRAAGLAAQAHACDITDSAAVDALIAAYPVDVVVNNAGVSARIPAEDYPDADLRRMLDLNVNGVFFMMRAAAKRWIAEGRGGRIINLASFAGLVADPMSAPYAASKGAVVQLTRTCAVEWADRGILVNAIAPGYVRTEMTAHTLDQPEAGGVIRAKTALGRAASTREIAGAAVYLASEASAYVTGAILAVDGGWTAM